MLPREHRLRSNQEFQRVYRVGRSWAHPLAALHVMPRPGAQRFGISASKKVGKAVRRNLVRRRIREILRAALPELKPGFDAIVVVRTGAADADFSALSAALAELIRRARLEREPEADPNTPYTLPAGGRPGRPDGARGRVAPAQRAPAPAGETAS